MGSPGRVDPGAGSRGSCGALALVGGYLGAAPPPTMAKMLHRKSISTIPIPPLLKPRQNWKR